MANTTKNENNHRNDSKMCKTKPVLSEAWAELSPKQRKERRRRNEEELGGRRGGGFKLDEAKIRAKGRQSGQYNYEQARSTRHAGRPADYHHIFTLFSLYLHHIVIISAPYTHPMFVISSSYISYLHHFVAISSRDVHQIFIISSSDLHQFFTIFSYLHQMFIISSPYLH